MPGDVIVLKVLKMWMDDPLNLKTGGQVEPFTVLEEREGSGSRSLEKGMVDSLVKDGGVAQQ